MLCHQGTKVTQATVPRKRAHGVTWIYIARSTKMASVGLPFLATFLMGRGSMIRPRKIVKGLLFVWAGNCTANLQHWQRMCRFGQNHIYTVHIRYFWQGNHQIYGHIRCIYTVLANPTHVHVHQQRFIRMSSGNGLTFRLQVEVYTRFSWLCGYLPLTHVFLALWLPSTHTCFLGSVATFHSQTHAYAHICSFAHKNSTHKHTACRL